ncbi:sec14 cytosolic factor [Niveomyces insectorum RCEF 264]|uniref:Sec14 cytosolic factor n=1 Tax=Niveomyces insectorum RCEF 264 TaxID=1081102 RepID=A0A167X989_9HYPO|nr:sec14 cytosolic factor [Niveomyces insectorum RCEF 264]
MAQYKEANAKVMGLDEKYDDYTFPIKPPSPPEGEEAQQATRLSGHPGYLSEQQQAQVHQLRLMLESQGYKKRLDSLTLLRFLRARKFDVNLALKMFVECEAWREKEGLDENVKTWTYPEKAKLSEYYPQYYHKTDKDGRPVYIEQLGKIDLKAMRTITSDKRMLTNLAVEYERLADERLPACSRKAGHLVETCCTIMDIKGVGVFKAKQAYEYIQQASAISQNHYPERLGRFYLINAPRGFYYVWSWITPFLDPVTVAKIHILGDNYQEELLSQVPAENLPAEFGGTCNCPDNCKLADMGPWREPEWASPPAGEPDGSDETNTPPDLKNLTLEAPGTAAADTANAATGKETAAA